MVTLPHLAVNLPQHLTLDMFRNRTKMGTSWLVRLPTISLATKRAFSKGSLGQRLLLQFSPEVIVRPKHFDVNLFFRFRRLPLWTNEDRCGQLVKKPNACSAQPPSSFVGDAFAVTASEHSDASLPYRLTDPGVSGLQNVRLELLKQLDVYIGRQRGIGEVFIFGKWSIVSTLYRKAS
jgi:hypothetical protein